MIIFKKNKDPENEFDLANVELSTDANNLPAVIEVFEDFLRACGYVIDGSLEIINDEEE